MKKIAAKFAIMGLLVAVLVTFCPLVLPLVNQAFAPVAAQKPMPVSPPPGVKHLDKVEGLVVQLTNRARQANGLAPLNQDDELSNVAQSYSDDMLVRQFFDHTTPDGVSFDERISKHYPHWVYLVGENIWYASGRFTWNPQKLAQEIVDDWMSSPGHRENLLDPRFTHLGVGVSARGDTIRATQEFVGRPSILSLRKFFTPWLIKLNKLCDSFN